MREGYNVLEMGNKIKSNYVEMYLKILAISGVNEKGRSLTINNKLTERGNQR